MAFQPHPPLLSRPTPIHARRWALLDSRLSRLRPPLCLPYRTQSKHPLISHRWSLGFSGSWSSRIRHPGYGPLVQRLLPPLHPHATRLPPLIPPPHVEHRTFLIGEFGANLEASPISSSTLSGAYPHTSRLDNWKGRVGVLCFANLCTTDLLSEPALVPGLP